MHLTAHASLTFGPGCSPAGLVRLCCLSCRSLLGLQLRHAGHAVGAAHGVGRAAARRAGPLHALLGHALLALPLADGRPRIPARKGRD